LFLRDLVDGMRGLAKADGVTLPGDVDAASAKIARRRRASTLDRARIWRAASASEIDHLNASSCGVAKRWGRDARNRLLHAIVS